MAKLLGLDVGEKRIGYAIGDSTIGLAFPRGFLMRANNNDEVIAEIAKICAADSVTQIIVGEPLGEENEETPRSKSVHAFIARLMERLPKEIKCLFVDESFSTKEALARIPLKRDRKVKGADDAIAAQILLERYMVSAVGIEPTTLGL